MGESLESLAIGVKITLKLVLKKWWKGMDWIQVAQDKDPRWAVVNTKINFNVP
jgi:hypothetical protein